MFWMAVVVNNAGIAVADASSSIKSHEKYHSLDDTESASNGRLIVIMGDGAGSLSESAPSFAESKYMVAKLDYVFNGYIVENVPERVLEEVLDSNQVKAVYEVGSFFF